jgi:DNA polymerase-3 subunit beta
MEVQENKFTMVALDGFRMAVKSCEILNDNNIKAVIPGKTLLELGKLLDDSEDEVNIFISKNQILFQTEDTTIISRLLEGEFINYNQLIPEEYKIKIRLEREKLVVGF